MSDDAKKQWVCSECSYIHTGEAPPGVCPVCGAPSGAFTEMTE